jgi:hypothetical protein
MLYRSIFTSLAVVVGHHWCAKTFATGDYMAVVTFGVPEGVTRCLPPARVSRVYYSRSHLRVQQAITAVSQGRNSLSKPAR